MPLALNRIKSLCFDVDGTLSDTDDLYTQRISFFSRILFRNPDHTARRFIMWIEAPGNALLGLADTLGMDDQMVAVINWLSRRRRHTEKIPADPRCGRHARAIVWTFPHGSHQRAG
ncbi:hypothetical protein [Candidatus Villigracilis saccharophilus]|uniref:hypothetical protein n=1 Tax=Candidatus Villigracilis saccharophilus TaxID=3140684 RepID=UPI003136D02A|nr:hypothetical protein [Anaerolineales bacterium]